MGQAVVPKKKKKPDDKHLVLRYFRKSDVQNAVELSGLSPRSVSTGGSAAGLALKAPGLM